MTILDEFMLGLVEEDTCPRCLGELDTGYECNVCDYDANDLLRLAADEALKMMGYD